MINVEGWTILEVRHEVLPSFFTLLLLLSVIMWCGCVFLKLRLPL